MTHRIQPEPVYNFDGIEVMPSIANMTVDEIDKMISDAYSCHFLHAAEIAAGYCYVIWQETLSPCAPATTRDWMETRLEEAGVAIPATSEEPYYTQDGHYVEKVEWYMEAFAAIVRLAIDPKDDLIAQQYVEAMQWTHPRFGSEGIDEPYDIAWNMQLAGGLSTLMTDGKHFGSALDPRLADRYTA